ncbi:MAG: hypothetical protein KC766_29760 [Myxococcales bacterium]|nr:hypothetical protein [Myxococcales bacterium]
MVREYTAWAGLGIACCALLACGEPSKSEGSAVPSAAPASFDAADLRDHEKRLRSQLKLDGLPGADVASGPDPYQLEPLPGGAAAGILRGADQVVSFDAAGNELTRVASPHSPSALTLADDRLWVVSDLSREIWRYPVSKRGSLGVASRFRLVEPAALRGLVRAGDGFYAADELTGTLLRLEFSSRGVEALRVAGCRGALSLRATPNWLGVNCLLEHRIKLFALPPHGHLTPASSPMLLSSAGPFWAFELWESNGVLRVIASGVEDAQLDRSIGSFGNVDSFLYDFRVDKFGARRLSARNVSELGVVLPKALWVEPGEHERRVHFAGYATSGLFQASWGVDGLSRPERVRADLPPGTSDLVRVGEASWLVANPLLDAWLAAPRTGEPRYLVETSERSTRSVSARVGEALFFTTLMAPQNRSEGKLSRFTCETCHFEGYTDGRIHATGRGSITATTKPLLGLVGNRPYFTRALDRDLAQMVNNEFRVAGANSGSSPVFSVRVSDWPWLRRLGVEEARLGPERLREALLDFLVAFNHRPNPYLAERGSAGLNEIELRGAKLFTTHCVGCHAPRLEAGEASSSIPESGIPQALLEGRPLVWASSDYRDTGVEPRVHPRGARPSSLRRLYKKAPYFTNGRAPDLASVLRQCGYADDRFLHQGVPAGGRQLTGDERLALERFLRLL